MMICKADFEELFPDLFEPEPEHDPAEQRVASLKTRWFYPCAHHFNWMTGLSDANSTIMNHLNRLR